MIGQAPLAGTDRWNGVISTTPGHTSHPIDVAVYTGDQWMPQTLGLSLRAGRWFAAEEVLPASNFPDISQVHVLQVTDSLARKLFKGKDPIGSTVYFDESRATVVGVVASLSRPGYHGGNLDQDSVVLPSKPALVMGPALGVRMRDDVARIARSCGQGDSEVLNRHTRVPQSGTCSHTKRCGPGSLLQIAPHWDYWRRFWSP